MEANRKSKRNHNEVHIVIETLSRALEHGDPAKKTRMKYDKSIKTTGCKKKKESNILQKSLGTYSATLPERL